MDALVSRIPLRPLPTTLEGIAPERLITIASWFDLTPTLDEFEEGDLTQLQRLVALVLPTLVPVKVQGYLPEEEGDLEILASQLSRRELLVNEWQVKGNHLKVSGVRFPDDDFARTLEETNRLLRSLPSDSTLILKLPTADFAPPRSTLQGTLEAVSTALEIQDPSLTLPAGWNARVKVSRDLQHLEFKVKHSTIESVVISAFVATHPFLHAVLRFQSPSNSDPSFLLPFCRSALESELFRRMGPLQLLRLAPERWLLWYSAPDPSIMAEVDPLLRAKIGELLSPSHQLRYYHPSSDPWERVFEHLEDLIPNEKGFISPYDRQLQHYYARFQGKEEIMEEVLRRKQEFLLSHQIYRRFSQPLRAPQALVLHYLAKYLGKSPYPLRISIERGELVVSGNLPLLRDGLSVYLLMTEAQRHAGLTRDSGDFGILRQLTQMEGDVLPSELVEMLALRGTPDDPYACSCPLEGICPAPLLPPERYSLFLPPLQGKILLQAYSTLTSDAVALEWWEGGVHHQGYSIISTEPLIQEEIFKRLVGVAPSPVNPPLPFRISGQDYQLEIEEGETMVRFRVLGDSKPVPVIHLAYLPLTLVSQDPNLIDTYSFWWRTGQWLTPLGRELYRLTRCIWPVSFISSPLLKLTPREWGLIPEMERKSFVAESGPKLET